MQFTSDELTEQIFPSNMGEGEEFEVNGIKYKSIIENPREIFLEITSWRGISMNAVHYYGKLYFYGLEWENQNVKGTSRFCGAFKIPKNTEDIDIELRRPVEDSELYTEAYEYYYKGSYVNKFNSVNEIKKLAKKIFKKHFTGNWKLIIKEG